MSLIADVQVIVSTNGTSGPPGSAVRSGSGAPGSAVGVDGDFYVDVSAYPASVVFYGPKAAGAWPVSGVLLTATPTPSGSVTSGTSFGMAQAAGSSATYSRGDHAHGTPTLPVATTSVAGIVQLDGVATDIQPLGTQAAGGTGKAADAGHTHPTSGVALTGDVTNLLALTWMGVGS